MRHALLALFAIIVFVGCSDDEKSCDGACKTVESQYALTERTIHAVDEKSFESEGVTYTLLRVEYGDTEECDNFDEDCSYSTYCGFVVKNEDYPLDFYFVTDEDALFDEDIELTGYDLPIFDDEDFDEWLWETDSDDEPLIECFSDY